MAGRESSQGWVYCFQLLVMPWRLSQNTFMVGVSAACLSGMLAVWWISATFLTFFCVAVNEPWGDWQGVWEEVVQAVVPMMVMAGVFAVAFVLAVWPVRVLADTKHRAVALALSPVCVVLPYTVWIVALSIVDFSVDVMNDRNVLNDIAETLFAQVAASCFWFPLLILGWLVNMVWSFRLVKRIVREQYRSSCQCGYDLRGSIVGGTTACPECGLEIHESLLANPLPLNPEV